MQLFTVGRCARTLTDMRADSHPWTGRRLDEEMVNFGERINELCAARAEWASYYVDYKALKRCV